MLAVEVGSSERVGDSVEGNGDVRNFQRREVRKNTISASARFRSWLAGFDGPYQRTEAIRELLKALLPACSEYQVGEQDGILSAQERALSPLCVGDTIIIVADRMSLALARAAKLVRVSYLTPLILLDARHQTDQCGNTYRNKPDFEVLDLEQFVVAVTYKRAWQAQEAIDDIVTAVIGKCRLPSTINDSD